LAGLGILSLVHKDVEVFAERLVRLSHLNPASRYPQIFVEAASRVTDTHLWLLAAAAALYLEDAEGKRLREHLAEQLRVAPSLRYEGKGRPTKRERREIEKLRGE